MTPIVFKDGDTDKIPKWANQFTHPWTDKEVNFVKKSIGKMTYKDMTKVIHRTIASIQSRVRFLPLKQKVKKYQLNQHFFKKWSEEMAYTLGFIASDGNVCKSGNSHMLQIASDDNDIIIKIKKALDSLSPIHQRSRTNGKVSYQLRFSDKIIYNDLARLGIKPRKSLILLPQKVPQKYIRHYLRGFFDGDGSVYMSHNAGRERLVVVWYTASLKMAKFLFKATKNTCPSFRGKIQKTLTPNKSNYYYSITLGHNNSLRMFKYLYLHSSIYMERKYQKFISFTK